MKQLTTSAAALLFILFTFTARAQKLSDYDQQDVEKVYADFTAAFQKLDAQAAVDLYTDNGLHIDPMGKIIRGHKELLAYHTNLFAYFKSLPKPDKTTHRDYDWNSRYVAPGLVMVSYTSEDINSFGDKIRRDKYSMAVLLKRVGDKWLADEVAMTPVAEVPE